MPAKSAVGTANPQKFVINNDCDLKRYGILTCTISDYCTSLYCLHCTATRIYLIKFQTDCSKLTQKYFCKLNQDNLI